ncbi:Coiled-coil domain-containing protein 58 [Quaeritorhiza haematococci]|nr:Coiled-coil domain-containing protein 58 [Quaeritorhiza haematococci]
MSTSMESFNLDELDDFACLDLTYFKKALRDARRLDDNIIPRLNGLTTRSPDVKASCEEMKEQLQRSYKSRERFISRCLKVADAQISEKKASLDKDPTNMPLKLSLQVDETQRGQIANEFTVESIIRDRTIGIFRDRCRSTRIPPDFGSVKR